MEALPSYQSHQATYQDSPYPLERTNDFTATLKHANETGYTDVLSGNRLSHSFSYPPPLSRRSPRNHEFQPARAQSRLQTRASPSAVTQSLDRQNLTSGSLSSLSAFPLPYRPQSVTHYVSSPTEYTSPITPLTSQDTRSYYLPSTQALPGRHFGFGDSRSPTSSASLPDLRTSDAGYSSSSSHNNWQTRDAKWPQSPSQTRRKYTPKGRRYDSPFNPRRSGPRRGYLRPPKKHPFLSTKITEKGSQNNRYKTGPLHDDNATQPISDQLPQPPRLARCSLPSSLPDDQQDASSIFDHSTATPTFASRYISSESADNDDSVKPIRESKYWEQMKDDPIFSDLSSQNESVVSIKELIQRRTRILQDHTPLRQQAIIMKEQGTQTEIESCTSTTTTNPQNRKTLDFLNLNDEQQLPPPPPPPPPIQHRKSRNHHYRTASLTDTDTPRIPPQQPRRTNNNNNNNNTTLKRSRSDTEDEYRCETHRRRRRADDVVVADSASSSTSSPPRGFGLGFGFGQRARTPFYSRRR